MAEAVPCGDRGRPDPFGWRRSSIIVHLRDPVPGAPLAASRRHVVVQGVLALLDLTLERAGMWAAVFRRNVWGGLLLGRRRRLARGRIDDMNRRGDVHCVLAHRQ